MSTRNRSNSSVPPTDFISERDIIPVLSLNNAFEPEVGALTETRLRHLLNEAFYARRIGVYDAMLIAFDETADYDSPNFLWFKARYPRFAYVDRIAVAEHARRQGLAAHLYRDLFAQARSAGHDVALCEVNIDPPNPISDAFHASFGFTEVGRGAANGKLVRYLSKTLGNSPQ